MKGLPSDLFDPRNMLESSDLSRGFSSSGADFGFAFNDSNFSDRLLQIEIMGEPPETTLDLEACTSIVDWARHRKRRREDIKKDNHGTFFLIFFSLFYLGFFDFEIYGLFWL